MGHRHSDSVLPKDWERRTWGLGFLSSHSCHKAWALSDDKRVKSICSTYSRVCNHGRQDEAQSAEYYWVLVKQPAATDFSHKCQESKQHSGGWRTLSPRPRDRQVCHLWHYCKGVFELLHHFKLQPRLTIQVICLPCSSVGRSSGGRLVGYWKYKEVPFFLRKAQRKRLKHFHFVHHNICSSDTVPDISKYSINIHWMEE